MRAALAAAVLLLALPASLAGAAAAPPPKLTGLTAWASARARLAFVATSAGGRRGYLWTQPYGSGAPRLLRTTPPVGMEEIDALAPGPNGTWACLERTTGNTESSYVVDVVSSRGGGAAVTRASTPILLAGDGTFLGYLAVTPSAVQLYRIKGARSTRVATLAGVAAPQEVAAASGHLAIRQANGTVVVLTDGGAVLARIPAKAASVALTANRVVVRTRDRRLAVYGLRGGLVHSWRLGAAAWTAGLAAYGRYAVYLGANKAVRAVRLSNGADRIAARAGGGFFFGGLALQAKGALVPQTTGRSTVFRLVAIPDR